MHFSQLSAGLFLRDQNILTQEGRVGATAWEVGGYRIMRAFFFLLWFPMTHYRLAEHFRTNNNNLIFYFKHTLNFIQFSGDPRG